MRLPINISKIIPPQVPHVLPRLRRLNLLDENRNKELILILEQAAQGKTTLAALWLQISKYPFACVNLDDGDPDASRLLESVPQSSLYAERGVLKTSVKYIINVKTYTQPASIIEHLGTNLVRQRRRQDLSGWIEALPEEIVEDDT
jgi:ATP/maltotriose-dependent transcriptional regulator MalT